jgi:hypothetical protein
MHCAIDGRSVALSRQTHQLVRFLRSLPQRLQFRFSIPLVLLLVAGWLWRENVGLQAQLASLRARGVSERITQRPSITYAPRTTTIRDSNETASGENVPTVDHNTNEEASVLETIKNEVVVSFGPIEQLGAQASQFFASHEAARLRKQASALGQELPSQNPEELLAEQRQAVEFLGALPEIVGFQNQQGLNEANKPTDGALAWEWKRDAFNEATAEQLNAVLPEEARQLYPISSSLMEFLEMDFDKSDLTLPAIVSPGSAISLKALKIKQL